jgi:type I restriction enzyme S subunit
MTNHNPSHSTVRFGDVAREVSASTRDPLADGFEYYIGLEHLDPESLKIRRWGMIEENETTFTRIFRAGQVLFGRRRAYQRKAALAEFDGICSGDIIVIEAKPDRLLPELLPFIVQTEGFYQHALSTSAGSLSPRTKWSSLAKYEFPLPPLDEQRRIAEILWAVEDAIEGWQNSIEILKHTKDRVTYELFSFAQIRRGFTEIRNECILGTIGSLAEINPSKPRDLDDDLEVSFVGMADVSDEGGIDNQEVKTYSQVKSGYTYFAENDILFAKITPCMENGKGAIAKRLMNITGFGSTEFHVLRPLIDVDREFIYQMTMSKFFRLRAEAFMVGTAGQKRVRSDFLEKFFRFIIPPIQKRIEIGKQLSMFDVCKDDLSTNLINLQVLKRTLLLKLL